MKSREGDELAKSLHNREEALRGAGPLHWAALHDPSKGGMLLASDLSRHSAVDKALGKALLSGLPVAGRILYSTRRIGEEIIAKAIRMGVGSLATWSVPFLGAVELAERRELVLVGKLDPRGFWVYRERAA
ncbi:MAG: formate dehydrogenase accessory sulfurtransferase FdhD [Thermoplasmata archaeon]